MFNFRLGRSMSVIWVLMFLLLSAAIIPHIHAEESKNSNKDTKNTKNDRVFAINMISQTKHTDKEETQITFDIASSTMANIKWYPDDIVELSSQDQVICSTTVPEMMKGKLSCDVIPEPGDNVFTVTIYDNVTSQIYFKRDQHFYNDAVNITKPIWHRNDLIEMLRENIGYVSLTGGGIVGTALLLNRKSLYTAFKPKPKPVLRFPSSSQPPIQPPLPPPITLKSLSLSEKITNYFKKPIRKRWNIITKDQFDLLWTIGRIAAVSLGVSTSRFIILKGMTVAAGIAPMIFGLMLGQRKKTWYKERIQPIELIDEGFAYPVQKSSTRQSNGSPNGLGSIVKIDNHTDKKPSNSPIRLLKWLGTTLMFTTTGDPKYLKASREYILPDDNSRLKYRISA